LAAAKDAQRRENCAFVTNKRDDLSMFNENVFDLIYSDITIQHIPAPASETYIREFFRILAPGGLAVFLVPDGPVLQPGTVHHRFETFYREQFRPFYKRVRGKQQVQVHRLACERVQQLITESGGQLLDVEVHPDWVNKSKRYKPLYYWAMKPAA
jgi:ubiquinone/menaquinone biosynthesis C-methylase UbiE